MASKELGSKVLTKIQNLISEIDRPPLSNNKRNRLAQNLHLLQGRQDKEKIYKKMSNVHLKRKDKIQNKLKDEVYQDAKQFDKFKVTNKTTLKILQQRSIKPIQERIGAIMAKKDENLHQLRTILHQRQMQHLQPFHRSIDIVPTSRKYTESDLQQFRADVDEKNKERIKKRNLNKLTLVRPDEPKVPIVNDLSRSLSVNRNLKKNYSENVFKRMTQYGYDIIDKKRQMIKQRKKEEGNFQPRLCKKSIQIIQNKRHSVHDPHLINHHCLCKIDHQSMRLAQHQFNKQKQKEKQKVSPLKKTAQTIKIKQQTNKKNQNENTPIRSKNKDIKLDKSMTKRTQLNLSTVKSTTPLKQKQTNTIKSKSPLKTPQKKSQKLSSQPSFIQKPKTKPRK